MTSTIALVVFIVAYVLFFMYPTWRSVIASLAAVVLLVTGCLKGGEAFWVVNWNVMGIFVGTLVLAQAFIESRAPAYFAEAIVNKAPNTAWALLFICMLTSVMSAFIENVATVLIIAPIALNLAKKLQIVPIAMMICIAICSNLQGTATLIGDPPSMILGGYAKMTFMDFFFYKGKPSIFFAVELGAVVSFVVLYFVFRKHRERQELVSVEQVRSWMPTIMLVTLIIALAVSSFFDKGFSYAAGIICMVYGIAALIWHTTANEGDLSKTVKGLDWDTTAFLVAIFIIVGSLEKNGWTDAIADWLAHHVGSDVFLAYTMIVFISIVVSAFVDNVPFLAAMLPVAQKLADAVNVPAELFMFGLLIGASLGGNVTPVGASANIVATGLLRKEGYPVSLTQWVKIAIPFTIAAVLPAYIFIWVVWS